MGTGEETDKWVGEGSGEGRKTADKLGKERAWEGMERGG